MKLIAINPKNQSKLNKATSWLEKYNKFNDLRDLADNNDDVKALRKYEKKCEEAFDKYLDACGELPKNQVKAIEKSDLY